jgi:O-antigen/teichoic acid export membrane protein
MWCILIIASDAITAIPFARLRTENRTGTFVFLKASNVIINFGLTVFFISFCKRAYDNCEDNFLASLYNPEIGIGYCFLANLMANLITLLLVSPQIVRIKLLLNTELLKEMLRYTWPLIILGLAGMVNETLDRIILKRLMPDKVSQAW